MNILYIINIKPNNKDDNRLSDMIKLCKEFYPCINFFIIFNDKEDMGKVVNDFLLDKKIDVVMCNYCEDYIISLNLPIIILERYDSCTLITKNRKYLNLDNVKAIFKEYTCKDPDQNNRIQVKNRLHYSLLSQYYNTSFKYDKNIDRLSPSAIEKIKPVSWNLYQYSFVCNAAMDIASNLCDEELHKPIDVFFVCNPHEDHDILFKYRTSGQNKIRDSRLSEKYNIVTSHIPKRKNYRETVFKSKVCICPYGLGSRIALDQLSILSGSIAVKPHMKHVNTNPNIYEDDFFEYVNYDWDDLIDKVEEILVNWENKYKKIGLERRNRAKRIFNKKYYVDTFVKAVRDSI